MRVSILVPVYNDWPAVAEVLKQLGAVLKDREDEFRLVIVNDGSTDEHGGLQLGAPFRGGEELRLRRNLGHQRAIAIGLAWLLEHEPGDAVAVMDGDGEDRPGDVPRLLDRFAAGGGSVSVFAERRRRSEGLVFSFLYALYRWLHRIATGLPVRIGNFSVLSRAHLGSFAVSSDAWNHYAAAMLRLGVPLATVPTDRGIRFTGKSKMNLVALMRHGLFALAVFADLIAVRLLVATGVMCGLTLVLVLLFAAIRLFTAWALPGWTLYASAFVLIILLQILSLTFSATLHAFSGSAAAPFLPVRDYSHFVQEAVEIPCPPVRGFSSAR